MIKFNVYLKEEDWISAMRGWRCDALLIPGTSFEALYYDGIKADINFSVEGHIIRWTGISKPRDLLVTLSLTTRDLSKLEGEKLQIERDKLNLKQQIEQNKLNLEQQKASVETKWKIITAVGAILSSLLTIGTTYFVNSSKSAASVTTPPRLYTYITPMSMSEDKCIASLPKILGNYGLHDINRVKTGVYATKGSDNIFLECNSDVKAVFLVISGPDDFDAKRMREDIKALLP